MKLIWIVKHIKIQVWWSIHVCLTKQIESGIFDLMFTKAENIFKFRFNHVNQCTKLISHSLSQILDQNDDNFFIFQNFCQN